MVSARFEPTRITQPGARDVLQRERQPAVEPEGPLMRGRRGRRHAEAPVVVDLRGAEHDPGELAERVRLLVGQPAAAEDPARVRAVRRPRAGEPLGDPVEGLLPGGRLEPARAWVGRAARSGAPGRRARAGAVRPLPHSAPRFTGKSARSTTSTPAAAPARARRFIPHCRAQYGQCVGVAEFCMPSSVRRPCYARDAPVTRRGTRPPRALPRREGRSGAPAADQARGRRRSGAMVAVGRRWLVAVGDARRLPSACRTRVVERTAPRSSGACCVRCHARRRPQGAGPTVTDATGRRRGRRASPPPSGPTGASAGQARRRVRQRGRRAADRDAYLAVAWTAAFSYHGGLRFGLTNSREVTFDDVSLEVTNTKSLRFGKATATTKGARITQKTHQIVTGRRPDPEAGESAAFKVRTRMLRTRPLRGERSPSTADRGRHASRGCAVDQETWAPSSTDPLERRPLETTRSTTDRRSAQPADAQRLSTPVSSAPRNRGSGSNSRVQRRLARREDLPGPAVVPGRVVHGRATPTPYDVDPRRLAQRDRPADVEALADQHRPVHAEDLLGADAGVPGVEPGVVADDPPVRHPVSREIRRASRPARRTPRGCCPR